MRGTLHFVAGKDLGWLLELTTARLIRESNTRRAQLELTDEQLGVAKDAVIAALSGGVVLERGHLLASVERAGVPILGQRGYHILWHLAQTGVLVFGPVAGKQQTFALLSEWIPEQRMLERDESLGELALRYFSSHGPATVKDLGRWASITLTDARIGLAIARASLDELDVDGVSYFLAPGLETAGKGVFALPGFDEYLLGYGDRSAALAPQHSSRIAPGGNGVFVSTIVVDGRVAGTWRRSAQAKEVVIEPTWFSRPSHRERVGFDRAIERYAEFVGRTARTVDYSIIS
jgi:hypothetical protein